VDLSCPFGQVGCDVSAKSGGSETSSSLSVSPEMPALNLFICGQSPAYREAGLGCGQFLAARLNL
jgi:hypothetical protein